MPTYTYKAVNKNGDIVKNRVEISDRTTLYNKLKENGLSPIAINEVEIPKWQNTKRKRNIDDEKNKSTLDLGASKKDTIQYAKDYLAKQQKITERDIVVFTQNFYLLKKANFNNVHALTTIIESTENRAFAAILEDILAGVEAGDYMYKTMEYYSNVFPFIYTNLIKVGELSGSLEKSLQQAVEYLDTSNDIRRKIKAVLIPNLIQFVLLIVVLLVGTLFALPQVEAVLEDLGASKDTIPAITRWFQGVVTGILNYWQIPVAIIVAIVVGIILYIRTPRGNYKYHEFKYKCPVFGKLIFGLDFRRLMRVMLLNLRNGLRIQEALEISKNVIKNNVMLSIIEDSLNKMLVGESWIEPFEKSGLASPMITEMLKIGMKTDLPEMMDKLVEYMEIDINNTIQRINAVLPQILYAIVGIALIFVVIVILVPMIQLYFGNFLFDIYM